MRTLWDAGDRQALTARLAPLTPAAPALWGTMNATQMLGHCVRSMRMALGDLPVAPLNLPLRYPGIRHLIIYALPTPKGAPTSPELRARPDETGFEDARRVLGELVARFGRCEPTSPWPAHPAFGPLSGRDWGVLSWKHLDHHFRQFGL